MKIMLRSLVVPHRQALKAPQHRTGSPSVSQQSDHKTGMGRKKTLVGGGLAALAIAAVISGCSSSKTSSTASDPSTSSAGSTSGAAAVASSAADAMAPTGNGPFAFGMTYSTGIETIKVSAPTKFTPSSSAVGYTSGDDAYYVTVTIGNAGSQAMDASVLQVSATIDAKATTVKNIPTTVKNIIDSGDADLGASYGSSSPFASSVAANTALSAKVAFDVPAAQAGGKISVEVTNLTAHPVFTGTV